MWQQHVVTLTHLMFGSALNKVTLIESFLERLVSCVCLWSLLFYLTHHLWTNLNNFNVLNVQVCFSAKYDARNKIYSVSELTTRSGSSGDLSVLALLALLTLLTLLTHYWKAPSLVKGSEADSGKATKTKRKKRKVLKQKKRSSADGVTAAGTKTNKQLFKVHRARSV